MLRFHGVSFLKASDQFQAATAQDPYSAPAEYHLGLTLTYKERLDEALQHLERSTELSPNYAGAHYEIGKIRTRQAKTKEALTALEKAARLGEQ